jgi:hypothetical protein
MFVRAIFLALLLPASGIADNPTAAMPDRPQILIRDPSTKVIYYLESDGRHLAAISPEGKLLWCTALFHIPTNDFVKMLLTVDAINFHDEENLGIYFRGKHWGTINKTTGVFKFSSDPVL